MLLALSVCTLANAKARSAIIGQSNGRASTLSGNDSGRGSDGKKCAESTEGNSLPGFAEAGVGPAYWR
jgi:hypothetical protein